MIKHLKKIAIAVVMVLTFNFITPTYSHAIDAGGILIKPVVSLIVLPVDIINGFMTLTVIGLSQGFEHLGEKISIERMTEKIQKESNESINQNEDSDDNSTNNNSGNNNNSNDSDTSTVTQKIQTSNGNVGEITYEVSDKGGILFLGMEDFFMGGLNITNINIFDSDKNKNDVSTIKLMKDAVAQWYVALRNLAGVGLLIALIYTAIRILLSSFADEKAHYKEMLINWVKAVCLVVFVHILMVLILSIQDMLVEVLKGSVSKYYIIDYIRKQLIGNWSMSQVGYLAIYVMLTYYTICFGISYFKRFLYTMLLIIIAPIVSLMYAFGKQGQEIFRKWLREFIYNALLQPYHLLIYTILFGWVASILSEGRAPNLLGISNLAVTILALIVAHFLRDAEKYLRGLFGIGQGVAGIGAYDTGDKSMKDVQNRAKSLIGTAAQALAVLVTGGASLAAGNSSIARAIGAQANTVNQPLTNASLNLVSPNNNDNGGAGGGDNGSGGDPGGGSGGGEPPINPPEPGEGGDTLPEDGSDDDNTQPLEGGDNNPPISGNNDNDSGNDSSDSSTSQVIDRITVKELNADSITSSEGITTEQVDTNQVDAEKSDAEQSAISESSITNIETQDMQSENANVEEQQTGDQEVEKETTEKTKFERVKETGKLIIDSRETVAAIDRIANALSSGHHVSVQPGQAPTTSYERGSSLGLGTIQRGREALRDIRNDEAGSQLSKGQQRILAFNEAVNGTTFEKTDRRSGELAVESRVQRNEETVVNNNITSEANSEVNINTSTNSSQVEELSKKIDRNNESNRVAASAVQKSNEKTNEETRRIVEGTIGKQAQTQARDDKNNYEGSKPSIQTTESRNRTVTNNNTQSDN